MAVLWSGGKESCLAYLKAIALGHKVDCIVTFVGNKPFLCHSLPLITLQSKALSIPHFKLRVEEPYLENYRKNISRLMETRKIEGIVTGDVCLADAVHNNWLEKVCESLDVNVIKPLWGLDLPQILDEIVSRGFKAVFTCVRQPWFDERWLGRELNKNAVRDLKAVSNKRGINLCGENGEYHTMVIDAPTFQQAIQISKFNKRKKNSLLFMKVDESFLRAKITKQ